METHNITIGRFSYRYNNLVDQWPLCSYGPSVTYTPKFTYSMAWQMHKIIDSMKEKENVTFISRES